MYLGSDNQRRVRHRHHRLNEHEVIDHHRHHPPTLAVDRHVDASDDHHPASAGSLRRHLVASLMRHHQSSERNKHALQPLSPASYGSSLEMAPYNPGATPDSSVELRGRIGESSYNFKTSTELLNVLNRIWSLEEQQASNMSLVKALKNELDHARAKIKELLRDQQANRHEVDQLMKQISEGNFGRKSKEQEQRIDAALQSVREELENERKLRKRSESLHRKLARELFEIKVSLSTSVKEIEKERKSTELLEELCYEFAKGISTYARQVHDVRQKSDRNWADMADHDNLILHISESWLDERLQIKDGEKSSIIDRLRPEIEAFLAARQIAVLRTKDNLSPRNPKEGLLRRQSLESIPERMRASQCRGHEDPASTDMCADMSKAGPSNDEEQEDLALSGRKKSHSPCTSVQMSDPQNTPREIDDRILNTGEGTPSGVNMLQKSEIYDALINEEKQQRRKGYNNDEGHGSNSKTVDKLMSNLLLSEEQSFPPEYESKEASLGNSAMRRNASPVRQWMTIMKSPEPRISGSSSKKAVPEKLQDPKSKEHKSKGHRSRLKFLKGST